MRKQVFRCDQCGKEEERPLMDSNQYPQHWFTLGYQFEGRFYETHHFCSEECMDTAVKIEAKDK